MATDYPPDPDAPRPAPRRRRAVDTFVPIELATLPSMGRAKVEEEELPANLPEVKPVGQGRQAGLFKSGRG